MFYANKSAWANQLKRKKSYLSKCLKILLEQSETIFSC
jgi:hypothetical protein